MSAFGTTAKNSKCFRPVDWKFQPVVVNKQYKYY